MPIFKFKAQKPGGEVYEGKREAADKFVLFREIKAEGDTVIFTEEDTKRGVFSISILPGLFMRVSMKEKIVLARNLGAMLEAGLPLSRALSIVERQSNKKGFKAVMRQLLEEINKGQALSDAMAKFPKVFSNLFVSMVKAGEESGSLPGALKNISDQLHQAYSLQKKVKGALIYPTIIVCLMIVIGIAMLIYVVPSVSAIFEDIDAELPLSTRALIFTSSLLSENTIPAFGGLLTVIVLLYFFIKSRFGKSLLDSVYLRLPIIGNLVREVNSARTTRTLSSLLGAGVEVIESFNITREVVQNHHFKKVLENAAEKIKKGEPVSAVFMENNKLYPIFVGEMMAIGEETGQLSATLGNVASYYEDEVDQKTKNLSTIIEPFLMILIGLAVVFFALSILGPIYSLADKFGG